jgi:DNA-binding NtrC family response regulator/serine/threonine protein kinase
VLDVELPGLSGLDLQQQLVKEDAKIPIIFLTGRGDIPMSVRAIKTGALDFLTKPFDDEQLLTAIRQAVARLPVRQGRGAKRQKQDCAGFIGTSARLKTALEQIEKVAATDLSVLIMGETGTGKELAARTIHNRSKRRCRAFVSVNCAAIPSNLIASELFGHEKGAFTGALQRRIGRFELAEGGTIFLDEVGDLSAEAQALLLRFLQEKEFERVGGSETIAADVRVIAAINRDLQLEIAAGTFRSDLFYRLNVFPIGMPPLRERKEDIPALVDFFISRHAQKRGQQIRQINEKTLEDLEAYSWPGNVRELENVVERSLIVCDSEEFSVPQACLAGMVETKTSLSHTGAVGRASVMNVEHGIAAGVCARCGKSITHPGPDGECVRCLVSFGFLAEDQEVERRSEGNQPKLGPLRYAHFEVEVNAGGYPVILGSGAMAVTYRARDTVLNSTVALKVISRKLAEDPIARARFLREARAAAQIHHPNVARVIHYGEQDGECFYAMELVHGETLEERVQRDGPLPLSLAIEVVEQTARGLAAGEACGVIHRDLKPSNLMTESDPTGQMLVKIIDYGVAKVMGSDPALQTQAGFIGTPAFASPEQFEEAGQQQIDARSDVYALGITFWYLLTGRTPFAGRSIEEVRARHAEDIPLKQLKHAHVPKECVGLLKSMLVFDPAKRPQTAHELLRKIHRCYVRFEPAARRRRKRFVLASVGLALALAALLLSNFVYQRTQSSSALDRSIAVLTFENLSSNPNDQFFAIGIQDEILTKLANLGDLKVIARTSTESYKGKPPDLRTVGKQLGVGRVLEGSVQRELDTLRVNVQLIDTRTNAHLWANTYDRNIDDVFAVESEVATAVAQQLDAKLVSRVSTQPPTQIAAAYNAYLRGLGIEQGQSNIHSFQDAATAYSEAVTLDPNFALAWARLCLIRSFLYYNGVDRDVNSAAGVKEAADRALALGPELGEAWLAQGTYRYRVSHDLPGALEAYREAEKRLPNSSLVNEYMVYVERRLGYWREAEVHLRRATDLDPRNFRLWARTAADDVFGDLRRFREAQAAINRALEISPNDQYGIIVKALLFQYEGRLDEAAKQLARLPTDSTDKTILLVRATQALLERNFEQVIFCTEQATKSVSPEKPLSTQDAIGLVYLGYAQRWTGRTEEARATFERMIQAMAPAAGAAARATSPRWRTFPAARVIHAKLAYVIHTKQLTGCDHGTGESGRSYRRVS